MNRLWTNNLEFSHMIDKEWKVAVQEQGAKALIRNFANTDTMLQSGKILVRMTTQLVNQVFGLCNTRPIDPKKMYAIEAKILAKGNMHQVKDVKSIEHRK